MSTWVHLLRAKAVMVGVNLLSCQTSQFLTTLPGRAGTAWHVGAREGKPRGQRG